jgi:hypothetical protein
MSDADRRSFDWRLHLDSWTEAPEIDRRSAALEPTASWEGSAMEPHPGVFVSTTGWSRPKCPEVRCISPCTATDYGGVDAVLGVDGGYGRRSIEVALILEGSVRIEIADGGTLDLGVGDLFSLPPGVETTWHVTTPFKEMWVLASD